MRPASVRVPFFDERSNSCSPSSTSSRRTAWLTAGCVRWTFAAAREKLRSCATARKIFSAFKSISSWCGWVSFSSACPGPRSGPRSITITRVYICVTIITLTTTHRTGYNLPMSDPARITVFDTTLRDGEQAPGFSMDVPAKLAMAHALDALGVDILEAGFPIASPADSEAVRQIAAAVRRPVIAALARTRPLDIEEAGRALAPAERSRIHTFLATSDLHLQAKLRMTREECLQAAVDAVKLARTFTDDVEFSAEDATRSDRDFLCRVVEAIIAAGATTINLPDTVGYATPDELRDFFADIIASVPNSG